MTLRLTVAYFFIPLPNLSPQRDKRRFGGEEHRWNSKISPGGLSQYKLRSRLSPSGATERNNKPKISLLKVQRDLFFSTLDHASSLYLYTKSEGGRKNWARNKKVTISRAGSLSHVTLLLTPFYLGTLLFFWIFFFVFVLEIHLGWGQIRDTQEIMDSVDVTHSFWDSHGILYGEHHCPTLLLLIHLRVLVVFCPGECHGIAREERLTKRRFYRRRTLV